MENTDYDFADNSNEDIYDGEYKKSMTPKQSNINKVNKITNNNPPNVKEKPNIPQHTETMKDRYAKAWDIIFNKQAPWRKEEITKSKQNKTFGNKRWDTDFINEVIKLAEGDTKL